MSFYLFIIFFIGELLGVDYLLSQTGEPLVVDPDSEETENMLEDVDEGEDEEDEGFGEDQTHDIAVSSLTDDPSFSVSSHFLPSSETLFSTQSAAPSAQPVASSIQPSATSAQPAASSTLAAASSIQPAASSIQPAATSAQPAASSTLAAASSTPGASASPDESVVCKYLVICLKLTLVKKKTSRIIYICIFVSLNHPHNVAQFCIFFPGFG